MSQFSDGSGPDGNDIYIAISQTSDPTSSWYTYTFTSPDFPDYLKFSAWQDGYYMTANFAQKIFAFNRSKMLAGDASAEAIYQSFSPPQSGFFVPLPADASDGTMPGAGTPCPVFSYSDNGWGGGNIDAVNIYNATVDWGALTMNVSSIATLPTSAFDGSYNFLWNDIPQPGISQKLDGIGGAMMFRAQWKPWTGYNTTVLSWAVRISASQRGIFWCELRQDQATENWSIYQQGIYAPDTDYYWMSSAAMNDLGDIALCYAKGSSGTYMSLAYTGRNAGDPLGMMTFDEEIAIAGTGVQTWTNRVGDYAHTCLDVDGVTFWHTGEYMGSGNDNPRTRIYSFQLPSATSPPVANFSADNLFPVPGQTVQFTDLSTNTPTSWTWSFSPSTITYQGGTDANTQNPQVSFDVAGYYTVTLTATNAYGSDAETKVDYIYAGPCSEPSNLNATAITNTSAQLSWTAGGGETQWNIEYGLQGFTQGTGTVINGVSNPYTLTGLTDSSSYDYYVQANCGDGYTSGWIGPFTFTTTDCSYCYAWGNTDYETSTTRVIFNTIDNPSIKPTDGNGNAYSDYTNLSTDIARNQSYDLSIYINTDGPYTAGTLVWIDWNQDCDFDDSGEEYDLGANFWVNDEPTNNSPLSINVPNDAKLGATRMRVITRYNFYPTSCLTDFDGEVEDYTVNIKLCDPSNTTTWNGSNWSDGTPDEYTTAIIDGNYTATTNFACCSMIVNSGNTITIPAGEYIEITDNLDMNGTLEVENEGSLVQWNDEAVNTGTGNFKIHKTTRPYTEYDYTFWSSPVTGESIGDAFNVNSSVYVPTGEPSNGTNHSVMSNIFWFNAANFSDANDDSFDDNGDDWVFAPASEIMPPTRGYIAMGAGSDIPFNTNFATGLEQSVYFESSTINNGNYTFDLQTDANASDNYHNENLVGNPYASAIDLEALRNADANNPGGNPIIGSTVQFWSHDTPIDNATPGPWVYNFTAADYATYNIETAVGTEAHPGSLVPNQYWASCQSIIVEANDVGALYFDNSMRLTSYNDNFFKSSETEKDALWLNMTNEEGLFRQLAVAFLAGADDNINDYDSKRPFLVGEADFYSMAPNDETRLVIQGLAPFKVEKVIPIGLDILSPGAYNINLSDASGVLSDTQKVYLKDKKTNAVVELDANGYSFTLLDDELGINNDRFEICFTDNTTVGLSETILAELSIYPNPSSDLFYFNWNSFEKLQIEVYNSQGQLIKTKWMDAGDALDMQHASVGVYYVVITSGKQQIQRKLIVQ
jgi:PKD repeat protein